MSEGESARGWFWGLVAIAVALPVALVIESVVTSVMMTPELQYLREMWGPGATTVAWRLVPIAALTDIGAYFLQLELHKRAAAMQAAGTKKNWKKFEGLMIAASVAQIPGIIAAGCRLVGADLTSVLAVMAVSTVGVLVLGVSIRGQQA